MMLNHPQVIEKMLAERMLIRTSALPSTVQICDLLFRRIQRHYADLYEDAKRASSAVFGKDYLIKRFSKLASKQIITHSFAI